MTNSKKFFLSAGGIFALANLCAFILFFVFTIFEGVADTEFGAFVYVYFLTPIMKGIDVLIPVSAAFILHLASHFESKRGAFLYGLPIALGRFIYLFLYYYLYFVYDGYSSIEACGISAAWSLLGCAIHYAVFIAIFIAIDFILKRSAKEAGDYLKDERFFNLSNPYSRICALTSAVSFVYLFVTDVINTFIFLFEYNFDITLEELASILISFIVDFAFLFIIYAVIVAIKRLALKKIESET